MYESPSKFLLALKCRNLCYCLVAMAQCNLVEVKSGSLAIAFSLNLPKGVRCVSGDAFDAGVELDIFDQIKVRGVFMHVLLEL